MLNVQQIRQRTVGGRRRRQRRQISSTQECHNGKWVCHLRFTYIYRQGKHKKAEAYNDVMSQKDTALGIGPGHVPPYTLPQFIPLHIHLAHPIIALLFTKYFGRERSTPHVSEVTLLLFLPFSYDLICQSIQFCCPYIIQTGVIPAMKARSFGGGLLLRPSSSDIPPSYQITILPAFVRVCANTAR